MKNKKNKTKSRIMLGIILGIILITIISVIYSLSTANLRQARKQLQYIISEEWNNEKYPTGMPELIRNYSGQQKAQNIGKSINYVATKVIPHYNEELKNANEKQISKYFEKNSKIIEIDIGIDKSTDFKDLINEISQKSTAQKLEFESYYIDENSIKQSNRMTEANLYIKYKGCEEIELGLKIHNEKSKTVSSIEYLAK